MSTVVLGFLWLAGCDDEVVGSIERWGDVEDAVELDGFEGGWVDDDGGCCWVERADDAESWVPGSYGAYFFDPRDFSSEPLHFDAEVFLPPSGEAWHMAQVLRTTAQFGMLPLWMPVRLQVQDDNMTVQIMSYEALESMREAGTLKAKVLDRPDPPLTFTSPTRKLKKWLRKHWLDEGIWLMEDGFMSYERSEACAQEYLRRQEAKKTD